MVEIYIHTLSMRAAKVLTKLRICTGSTEPSLLDNTISTQPHELAQMLNRNPCTAAATIGCSQLLLQLLHVLLRNLLVNHWEF